MIGMKMNKKIFAGILISLTFTVSVFAKPAEVISVKGKVEVQRNDQWIPLAAGDKIEETETISTGFQSEAKIRYNDSVMQLGALSRVTLTKLSSNASKDVVDVYLNTGAVRSKVNHSADKKVSYSVRGPVATASVRGTDFISFDDGSVICFSGAVVLTPAGLYDNSARENSNLDEIEDPADGESDAGTDINDVDPNAPKGGVLVLGGQSSEISSDGQASSTFEKARKDSQKSGSSVKTQSESEGITMGQSGNTQSQASDEKNEEQAEKPSKGGIKVKVEWED